MNRALRRRHAVTWWILAPLLALALIWIGVAIFAEPVPPSPSAPVVQGADS